MMNIERMEMRREQIHYFASPDTADFALRMITAVETPLTLRPIMNLCGSTKVSNDDIVDNGGLPGVDTK